MSVYLHEEIASVLKCYGGDLSETVNRVLDAASEGHFSVMDKPVIPCRDGAGRYTIDVKNEEYLELVSMYPPNSVKVSLRRLLYWFVENEMYDFLGWEVVSEYRDRATIQYERLVKRIRQTAEKLEKYTPTNKKDDLYEILRIIKSMET